MRTTVKFIISFIVILTICEFSVAFFGAGESAILSKILVEDVKQTMNLSNIMKVANNELSLLNAKYGYQKWINKGLDKVKNYGFLDTLYTDDYILGQFQNTVGQIGFQLGQENFTSENIDEWIDQVWKLSPELINPETNYSGDMKDWNKQFNGEMPGVRANSPSLRFLVDRKTSEFAIRHHSYMQNFNKKIRDQYLAFQEDATNANPGYAQRINAQSNALQNLQMSQLNDTQALVARIMAQQHLNEQKKKEQEIIQLRDTFVGFRQLIRKSPGYLK